MSGKLFKASFVLVAFALYQCEGQTHGQDCPLPAGTEPKGICGPRLAAAHTDLCFLLSRVYPEFFGEQSSSTPSSFSNQDHPRVRREAENELLEQIYSMSLSDIAELDIGKLNWKSFESKKADNRMAPRRNSEFIQMLKKRSTRSIQGRGLVCDCCINECTPRGMAIYC